MSQNSGDVAPPIGMHPPPQHEPDTSAAPSGNAPQIGTKSDIPGPDVPVRIRRTHISEHACDVLWKLALPLKLVRNKKIEAENLACADKTADHELDPVAHPDPGSPQASVISLMEEDESQLRVPAIVQKLMDCLPNYIIAWLAAEDAQAKDNKRKHDKALKDPLSAAEDKIAKRHCMQGSLLSAWDPLALASFSFPQILFDTENLVGLPLPFFTQKNLRYIIDELASLPTRKANSCSGDGKSIYILDIEKLLVKLGAELLMDFGSYLQAADQFYKFQLQRSADQEWAEIWRAHFRFFDSRPEAAELYLAWMHAELKLRHDTRTYHQRYLVSDYEAAFNHSVAEHKQCTTAQADLVLVYNKLSQMEESIISRISKASGSAFSGLSRCPGAPPGSSYAHHSSGPLFLNGNRSSVPPTCLLCAETGHGLSTHPKEKSPAKFPDGKNAWARLVDGRLVSHDNKEICIGFNLCRANSSCVHGATRVHVCSFCGSKSHHAFSYTCRPRAQ
ncbi:hypothetical protein CVT25_015825 [Psilocybe cyanescens]|uniref:Uncharacterized protein n=1 Tax=Psilocybe cyanescens TaxID=93625 RepID=A0A409XT11_PSICY|nr:hypothetical protein CVT25_015825 [Psilocybe cyanescens]